MENLFIMKNLKKYSDYLKEVVRKMREKNRVRLNAEALVLGRKTIVLIKKDITSVFLFIKDTALIEENERVVSWYKLLQYQEAVENNLGLICEFEEGLERSVEIALEMCKKYQIDPGLEENIIEI